MKLAQSFAAGTLRHPLFDAMFIFGIPFVALGVGALVAMRPELFLLVFTIDLWLLGYHHVAATFTRVCFDSQSFQTHRSLITFLPFLVALAVVGALTGLGLWIIATVYLYWQWWHYTRQSEGIQKSYAARNRDFDVGNPRLGRAVHYAVPIAGILTVSARQPETFLFMPIKPLPIPTEVALLAQAAAALLVLAWLFEQFRIWRDGRLAASYSGYLATHVLIYAVAYVGFEDATSGWLVINIWHNAQYLAFVWLYNNRRFSAGVEARHALLSTLSQTRNWWLYLLACLTVSTAFYYSSATAIAWLNLPDVAYLAAFYQIVNFHHYVVDSKIWKLRRPAIRKNLGIA